MIASVITDGGDRDVLGRALRGICVADTAIGGPGGRPGLGVSPMDLASLWPALCASVCLTGGLLSDLSRVTSTTRCRYQCPDT